MRPQEGKGPLPYPRGGLGQGAIGYLFEKDHLGSKQTLFSGLGILFTAQGGANPRQRLPLQRAAPAKAAARF
jgi:hypothetical protein